MTEHPLWMVIISAIVAAVPLLMGLATSYVKVSIVFGLLRSALGTQQVPGALVTMALSLAVTIYVMGPVFDEAGQAFHAIEGSELKNTLPSSEVLLRYAPVVKPWREFLEKHAGPRELAVLQSLPTEAKGSDSKEGRSRETQNTLPEPDGQSEAVQSPALRVLLPAFLLSELREAFTIGCILLLPFLVIDLIVANIMVGLGMFMVSPVLVSLPLKILLFVLCDGWLLLTKSLVMSYYV